MWLKKMILHFPCRFKSAFKTLNRKRPFTSHGRFYSSSPLRILFCGSDDLSCAVLRRLHAETHENPSTGIASIDVLCRPGKFSGRGRKILRESPLKATAAHLGLPLHERDTFTGWAPPHANKEPINLIVAVSFGLFVPPRLLKAAAYGGLNVHPSLLPDLRGPSPVHYAVLKGYTETGVSLQTLSPERFDGGAVLCNARIPIPDPDTITTPELQQLLTQPSADILIHALRERLYLQSQPPRTAMPGHALQHAPKVKSEDMKVRRGMSAEDVSRIYRALGKVWTGVVWRDGSEKRALLHDVEVCAMPDEMKSRTEDRGMSEMREASRTQEDAGQAVRLLTLVEQNSDGENGVWTVPMMKTADEKGVIVALKGENALLVRGVTIDSKSRWDAVRALWQSRQESSLS